MQYKLLSVERTICKSEHETYTKFRLVVGLVFGHHNILRYTGLNVVLWCCGRNRYCMLSLFSHFGVFSIHIIYHIFMLSTETYYKLIMNALIDIDNHIKYITSVQLIDILNWTTIKPHVWQVAENTSWVNENLNNFNAPAKDSISCVEFTICDIDDMYLVGCWKWSKW